MDQEHEVLHGMANVFRENGFRLVVPTFNGAVFAATGGGVPSQANVSDLTQKVTHRTGYDVQQRARASAAKRPLLKMEP